MYRERANARRTIPRRSFRIRSTMKPVRRRMMVNIWTDWAGDGMAFSSRVRKKELMCAAEAGRMVRRVNGGADGRGRGA